MPQAVLDETAPCPKCRAEMILAAITPHPVATQLARHTYVCRTCNQTKTYVLQVRRPADGESGRDPSDEGLQRDGTLNDRRREPREVLATPATLYDKERNFLLPCILRDLSKSGGRLELFKEASLPQYFLISLLPDGSARRLCSKVWQIGVIAGVRFVEKLTDAV